MPPGFVSYSKVERVRLEDGSTYVTSFNVDKGRMSFSESVTQTYSNKFEPGSSMFPSKVVDQEKNTVSLLRENGENSLMEVDH